MHSAAACSGCIFTSLLPLYSHVFNFQYSQVPTTSWLYDFQARALGGSLVTEGFSNTLCHFFYIKYRCYDQFVVLCNTFAPELVITLGNG